MEVVNTLDIDGTQWEIQDVVARNQIAEIKESLTAQGLQDIEVIMNNGYTSKSAKIENHYKIGKIHFMTMSLINISGNNIGTTNTAYIGRINILPKKDTSFLLNDYINNTILRCYLRADGTISIGESNNVQQGKNACLGELIFAEA